MQLPVPDAQFGVLQHLAHVSLKPEAAAMTDAEASSLQQLLELTTQKARRQPATPMHPPAQQGAPQLMTRITRTCQMKPSKRR